MTLNTAQRRQAHLSGISGDIAEKYSYLPNSLTNTPLNSRLPAMTGGLLTVSNVAYWVYLGNATRDLLATQIYFFASIAGAGTKVQELVIAHSATGPDRAAKTITVDAVANATGDYVGGTGSFTNTTAFSYHVPAGTELWVGCRFALTSTPTQPTLAALGLDTGKGRILSTSAAGVLAVGSTYTGALISQSTTLTTAMAPDLTLVVSTS